MTYEEGREATRKLLALPCPPEAILAMNDTLAFAAMKEIKEQGLRIPQDVALIDIPMSYIPIMWNRR